MVGEIMIEFARMSRSLTCWFLSSTLFMDRCLWPSATFSIFIAKQETSITNIFALLLVDQVHAVLGRHRADDSRCRLDSVDLMSRRELNTNNRGLRIGKELNERRPEEPFESGWNGTETDSIIIT